MAKVFQEGYVRSGDMKILTHYFSVTNEEDIRMVYNGMLSGLNNVLWALHFALHKVSSTLRVVELGEYMADRDIGYMLLKFTLSEEVRPFCGGDVYNVGTEEDWVRVHIGG